MRQSITGWAGCAALVLAGSASATSYQLTDFGNQGSGLATANGLNAAGDGVATASPGGPLTVYQGFRTGTGGTQALQPLLPGEYTRAFGLNDRGWAVGDTRHADGWARAVLWKKNKPQDLGKWPSMWNSVALAINRQGDVVGYSDHGARYSYGIVWSGGTMRQVGPGQTTANGINDAGEVIGNQRPYPSNGTLNCWHQPAGGNASYLPKLAGNLCSVAAINQAGEIAGGSMAPDGRWHAVLYRAGQPIDLGSLGGTMTVATGLNDQGGIVGYGLLPDGSSRALLFAPGADPLDLNTLLEPVSGAGYVLLQAVRINDNGQIAATASKDGTTRAVLLTPLP